MEDLSTTLTSRRDIALPVWKTEFKNYKNSYSVDNVVVCSLEDQILHEVHMSVSGGVVQSRITSPL